LRRRQRGRVAPPTAEEAPAGGAIGGVTEPAGVGELVVAQLGDLEGQLGVHATMVRD
jgi:hypothetical protein